MTSELVTTTCGDSVVPILQKRKQAQMARSLTWGPKPQEVEPWATMLAGGRGRGGAGKAFAFHLGFLEIEVTLAPKQVCQMVAFQV